MNNLGPTRPYLLQEPAWPLRFMGGNPLQLSIHQVDPEGFSKECQNLHEKACWESREVRQVNTSRSTSVKILSARPFKLHRCFFPTWVPKSVYVKHMKLG